MAILRFANNTLLQGLIKSRSAFINPLGMRPKGFLAGANLGPPWTVLSKNILIFELTTETTSQTPGYLGETKEHPSGLSNSAVAGYVCGGTGGGTAIDKMSYLTESVSRLSATLTNASYGHGEGNNYGTAGYIVAGSNVDNTRYSNIDKISFSADTKSTLSGQNSTIAGRDTAAISNSGTAFYWGFQFPATGNPGQAIDKLAFSTDTKSTISQQTENGTVRVANGSYHTGSYGYFSAGYQGEPGFDLTTVRKFTFSSETMASLGTGLSTAGASFSFQREGHKIYIGSPSPYLNKFQFSTDTRSIPTYPTRFNDIYSPGFFSNSF